MKLWQVTAQVITERKTGTTSIGVPTFFVLAQDADHAVSQASLVLMCDRRTDDGIKVAVSGTVAIAKPDTSGSIYGLFDVDGEGYASFNVAMVMPQICGGLCDPMCKQCHAMADEAAEQRV